MAQARVSRIKLVVSDVDGTLVTPDKQITPATAAAARRLGDAGVHLALVSSRPPRGMAFIAEALGLDGPLGGFNGATILAGETVLQQHYVPEAAVRASLSLFAKHGVSAWVFADGQWLVHEPDGDYVAREQHAVRFEPTVVGDFTPYIARTGKLVGVCTDFALLADCETALQARLGMTANAHRSQHYYLDVTSPDADKGTAARAFAEWFGVDLADTCAIGDQHNDVPMFRVSGHSIAMGNAPPAVAGLATHRTTSNEQDGWAAAIGRFVLA